MITVIFKNKSYRINPKSNFVAKGGEGSIYRFGNLVFKLLHNDSLLPNKKKIDFLESVRCQEVNLTLGFTEPKGLAYNWIEGIPFAECVTNDFWKTYSYDKAEKISLTLRECICRAHEKSCIIGDLNGNNILVNNDIFVIIDVEAWGTPDDPLDYKTTKISPAIRDWREKKVGRNQDWFAFGILVFELYVGIHPFRAGRIAGYGQKDWPKRIIDGKSAFVAKDISPNCRPIDAIPENLRQWMERIFSGKREPPPEIKGLAGYIVEKQPVRSHDNFELILLQEYDSDILWHNFINNHRIVKTKTKTWIEKVSYDVDLATMIDNDVVLINKNNNHLELSNITDRIPCETKSWGMWQGRIFTKIGEKFHWYKIGKLGKGFYVAPETTLFVYEIATRIFNGFCVVNAEGKKNIVTESIYRCQELDEYKIISGQRLSENILILIGERKSELIEFVIGISKGKVTVRSREVEYKTILAASPRKDFIVQLDVDEVRLTSGSQVQTFKGTFSANLISTENEKTVVAIGNQLFQLKTKTK